MLGLDWKLYFKKFSVISDKGNRSRKLFGLE